MRTLLKKKDKSIYIALGVILFALIYIIISNVSNNVAVPTISRILSAFIELLKNTIWAHIWSSAKIILMALGIALGIGLTLIPMAYIIKPIRYINFGYLKVFTCISVLSVYQLILIVFGINDFSRAIMLCWIAVPSFSIAVTNGLIFVEENNKSVMEAAMLDCPNEIKRMYKIKMPMAVKYILVDTKQMIGTCYISLLVAEMLGSHSGLGYLIMWNMNTFHYEICYAVIIYTIICYGVFLGVFMLLQKFIERRYC